MTDTVRTILLVAFFIYFWAKEVYQYVKGRYDPYVLRPGKISGRRLVRFVEGFLPVLPFLGVEWKRYWSLVAAVFITAMAAMMTILNCLAYRKSKDKEILVETLYFDLMVGGGAALLLWVTN